eukprot:5445294-Alexandrium_andersonii.AAC.1
MSASLVGSEMCIRDRVSSQRGRAPRTERAGGVGHQVLLGPKRKRWARLCLLYTSDAADDM